MAKFLTVDRTGTLAAGMELSIRRHTDINLPELQQHVDLLFPDGVSNHGDTYFLKNSSNAGAISPAIELLFEYVRRSHFSDRPSRFTSVFAVDSLVAARTFIGAFGNATSTIWEVEAQDFFKANMNLLSVKNTTLVHSYLAHQYWKGEAGLNQQYWWEYLLVPPVKVIRRITEDTWP